MNNATETATKDSIANEAIKAFKILNRLRQAERQQQEDGDTFEFVDVAKLLEEPMRSRGEPAADAKASEVFSTALHFWALRVAPLITYDEWEAIAWRVAEAVPDFDGDVIRRMENLFEGMTLADGSPIIP